MFQTNYAQLIPLGATRTQFETIQTRGSSAFYNGMPLGQGACKAVLLQTNALIRNTTVSLPAQQRVFYVGDATRQEHQRIDSNWGMIPIFCKDLSEVYVRGNAAVTIQILIYLGEQDAVKINPNLQL